MGGVIGGGLTVSEILGITPSLPSFIGLGILFVCFSVAQFLAYHDLRTRKEPLANEIKIRKQERIWNAYKEHMKLICQPIPDMLSNLADDFQVLVGSTQFTAIEEGVFSRAGEYLKEYIKLQKQNIYSPPKDEWDIWNDNVSHIRYALGIDEYTPQISSAMNKLRAQVSKTGDDFTITLTHKYIETLLNRGVTNVFSTFQYPKDDSFAIFCNIASAKDSVDRHLDKLKTSINKRLVQLSLGAGLK